LGSRQVDCIILEMSLHLFYSEKCQQTFYLLRHYMYIIVMDTMWNGQVFCNLIKFEVIFLSYQYQIFRSVNFQFKWTFEIFGWNCWIFFDITKCTFN
jgi:hypothetical protein